MDDVREVELKNCPNPYKNYIDPPGTKLLDKLTCIEYQFVNYQDPVISEKIYKWRMIL